jgi:hypothetical protein
MSLEQKIVAGKIVSQPQVNGGVVWTKWKKLEV